jgi:hypothetical protein
VEVLRTKGSVIVEVLQTTGMGAVEVLRTKGSVIVEVLQTTGMGAVEVLRTKGSVILDHDDVMDHDDHYCCLNYCWTFSCDGHVDLWVLQTKDKAQGNFQNRDGA